MSDDWEVRLAKAELRESMNELDQFSNPTRNDRAISIGGFWKEQESKGVVPTAADKEITEQYIKGVLPFGELIERIKENHPEMT